MNERIRQLQIQADTYADEIVDRKGKMYGEIVMKRFAELIVQECARVFWNIDDGELHSEYVWALKNHFEVQ